jgi:hypothetical protein
LRRLSYLLVCCCSLFLSSLAFATEGRDSVAAEFGAIWPENTDVTWYAEVSARFHIENRLAVQPDFGYWKQDDAEHLHLAAGDLIYSLRDYHVGASLLWMGTWKDIGMYAGGGLAAHWRKRETSQDVVPPKNNPDIEETRLGLQILWGVDIPIAKMMDITATVRDDFIFRGDLDTLTHIAAYGGLRFYWE